MKSTIQRHWHLNPKRREARSRFAPGFIRAAIALLASATIISGCSDSASPDAGGQNTLRIDYEITVPAYISDSLQVRLTWDENDIAATWIGDEYWTASDVFLTDTQTAVTVTFYDNNGDLTLGTAELNFITETSDSQTIQVTVEQFDTVRWDDDGDGVSNLGESIAGTDPLFDDPRELEMRENFNPFNPVFRPDALEALEDVSAFYESSIPSERPYSQSLQENVGETFGWPTPGYTFRVDINLDSSGTGSYFRYNQVLDQNDNTVTMEEANRTEIDGDVTWTGMHARSNNSSAVSRDYIFTTESSRVDESTRRQDGVIDYTPRNVSTSGPTPITITYSLTGEVIDGSSDCLPVAGVIRYDGSIFRDPETLRTHTTLSKRVADEYWRVTTSTPDGLIAEEFLLRSLSTTFYCEFATLQLSSIEDPVKYHQLF